MKLLTLHPNTLQQVDGILTNPAHAYLFCGPRYCYKQQTAEQVALKLAEAATLEDPNILLVQPGATGSIKISQVKDVLDALSRTAYRPSRRGVVVAEAHTMTTDASNALLKILEEPAEGVTFMLVSDRVQHILPTVRSRTQQISFLPPEEDLATDSMPPRLRDQLAADPDAKEHYAAIVAQATGFVNGNLSDRFLISKKVTDAKYMTDFIEVLERELRQQAHQKPSYYHWLEQIMAVEDQLAHNVNARLCLENFALEVAA